MSHCGKRDVPYTYSALNNENVDYSGTDLEDTSNIIIHKVPKNKGGWTHIKDLDSFFARMYRYYIRGGFYPMIFTDLFCLCQYIFIIWFSTFLIHCIDYPRLFRDGVNANRSEKLTLGDVIISSSACVNNISWKWWSLIGLCSFIWFMKLCLSLNQLYYTYETKLFYNNALKIQECDLAWVNWSTIQDRVREAQFEHQMCVHKLEINELDIYHRILRINNYMVAMVNKNLLPLRIRIPIVGEIHYLSRGLKWNLEFLLFSSPWSPWDNSWKLREAYKEHSQRKQLARQLERQILLLALFNLLFAPFIQAWQILYFFFNYAELVKRSPASLGLRTWSLYARVTLRHFNELEHELRARLTRAHKPAAKYLNSFHSPITAVFARNTVFVSGSLLGVLVMLTVYDEDVLTVEYVLTIITVLGCILAAARALIGPERGGGCGPARGEELLVHVLGHVHYLPAAWRGRAHTRDVAVHFQQLFQFRAVYIIFELVSPLLCPLVLLSLRARAIDIVDFYRNFTVSVLGIGDVCSFAQLDIRRHGHPDWQTPGKCKEDLKAGNTQYEQGEGGKTELSLMAFSCRHPGWHPAGTAQRDFLRSLRHSVQHAMPQPQPQPQQKHTKNVQGSFVQQSLFGDMAQTPTPAVLSHLPQQKQQFRLPEMDETSDEDGDPGDGNVRGWSGVSSVLDDRVLRQTTPPLCEESDQMSVSTLHLYNMHLSQMEDPTNAAPA